MASVGTNARFLFNALSDWTNIDCINLLHMAVFYLTLNAAGRSSLYSLRNIQFTESTAVVHSRSFGVAGPTLWNELSNDIRLKVRLHGQFDVSAVYFI